MRSISHPTTASGARMEVGDVFDVSISNARSSLKAKFEAIRPQIIQAATAYDQAAGGNQLHQTPKSGAVGGVSKAQLKNVYSVRMVLGPGRSYYDRILVNAPGTTCPLCGVGLASTLDHHLPKAKFTLLSVTPANLVPSCERCQFVKLAGSPATAEEETLHPYFDDFEDQVWLKATVRDAGGAVFTFTAEPPAAWGPTVAARLRHHLAAFDLGKLYSVNAANHLAGIRHSLQEHHASGGAAAVRQELNAGAASREANLRNSWETAMYRAAADSPWFCDGGFAVV